MRNSSRILPLVFVNVSCHEVDLELLFIAMRTPAPLGCCGNASIFNMSVSILCLISMYMLANKIFDYQLLFLKQLCLQPSYFISIVSTRLIVTTIAAQILPSPDANILCFFDTPAILVWILYGSWMHSMSVLSSVIFIKLSGFYPRMLQIDLYVLDLCLHFVVLLQYIVLVLRK